VPDESPRERGDREAVVDEAIEALRADLQKSRLFGRKQIDDLVSYARFLASGQVTERDRFEGRSVDE
jgi:hypothetical protein